MHYLALATVALAAVGAFAAVVRDVPIINAFNRPKTETGHRLAFIVFALFASAYSLHWAAVSDVALLIAWPIALAYFAWCVGSNLRAAALLLALWPSPAMAWNATGHKCVADIAWQELDAVTRKTIVDTLRRHPRFDEDFEKKRDESVADEDRWIFQQAATWPDLIRGNKQYDKPSWHYLDFPLFVGPERPVTVNMALEPEGDRDKYNVVQAVAFCRSVLDSNTQPANKAIAYCWLFHLVGDLHQPMHSVALVCDRFPDGDRGGNDIPLAQGKNLHALWDNFLGRQSKMADVQREIATLKKMHNAWQIDVHSKPASWIRESRSLADDAYEPILAAVEKPCDLTGIELPRDYMTDSARVARKRIVAAGLRLAALLGAKPHEDEEDLPDPFALSAAPKASAPAGLTHWLNLNGNVRHNSTCKWYHSTKRGRPCSADEGRACQECGG